MSYSIMLIDDNFGFRTLLGIMLRREGFIVYSASDAYEALHHVDNHVPHLFLIDMILPGMSGSELCQHLRADQRTAHIPIIMISAHGDHTRIEECLQRGANRFLAKPIVTETLFCTMRELLRDRNRPLYQFD